MDNYNEKEIIAQLENPAQYKKAFECIVAHYSEQLYWQIRRMTYSHDDSNDILQNTFIKAWTNLEQFRGDSKISTWLYRIAVNETLNFLQRKKESISLDDSESALVNLLTTDEYFDGDETALQLQQAISLLPEKQRMVFNLKYFQEMKYEEMSRILHTSTGSLKASYHHAVKKIQDFFEKSD